MDKREQVESWLNITAQEMSLCESANDPYPCFEEDDILSGTEGLVFYEQGYGWLYSSPSDVQVERMYQRLSSEGYFESNLT